MAIENETLNKRVYVRELKDALKLKQITGDGYSLDRWIIAPDVNRPGLELTGNYVNTDLKRIEIIGNKETAYIKTLDEYTQRERFNYITDEFTPCIIITSKDGCPEILKDVASEKNFPVFIYDGPTWQCVVEAIDILSDKMAPTDSIHGVMMNIYGIGVLITGRSGIGKSELALDLIKKGHILVADDVVDVINLHNEIYGQAPEVLKGMLEIRGLGVVDVELLFGGEVLLDRSELSLVINLEKFEDTDFNRVEGVDQTIDILGKQIPWIQIPVSEGRPLSAIIEASVTNYILKKKGINTTEIFKQNILKEIEKNRSKK